MDVKSKNSIWEMIAKDLLNINKRHEEISKRFDENAVDQRDYLQALFNQLSQPSSVPVVTKTPRVTRKRGFQRIETILEDDVLEQENIEDTRAITEKEKDTDNIAGTRIRRIASLKAVDNIAKQSLLLLKQNTKLTILPDNENVSFTVKKGKRESQLKRKKSVPNSSDEDENTVPPKYSKLDIDMEDKESKRKTIKMTEQIVHSNENTIKKTKEEDTFQKLQRLSRSESKRSQEGEVKKENDAIISPMTDIVEESIYEDAIGKPTPIMNSTLKYSSIMPEKILNVTVVLEPLSQQKKLNETVVINKGPCPLLKGQWNSTENNRERTSLKKVQQSSTRLSKEAKEKNNILDTCNGLITDDESSPELKKSRKQTIKKLKKHILSDSSDDEVPNTPIKNTKKNFKEPIAPSIMQEIKTTYKSNALFSPYAKESVKKRVEAFEQAVNQSPKSVDTNAPTRITRTKTRAMAAAEAEEAETKNTDKNYTQILARKSLAKAKKIAYFAEKQRKENEESREDNEQMSERNKLIIYDKLNAKQTLQPKTTPLSKPKIVAPMSATRFQTPLSTQNLVNHGKALTVSRANIVTTVESFIQAPKTVTKNNSADKLEDKKRHEEDAIKKRKEALRLQTEEKKRKREEKELKNKLAREAKDKQELEKRQKAEREREEKAKLAQLIQEKQREEMEKKRLAQLQRAQEKEERRKLEEQQRLQKLLEQEEAERLLAEQKRREQEAERRKEMVEARAQQQAEALRQKNMMQAAQTKDKQDGNKQQGVMNYVLDSEPDDEESDDESRPKHEIPHWAHAHVRKAQLAMQRHIPNEIVYIFFDTRKCTPDLAELFQGIDRNRLKRTSSAIWKTPPRFSMMEGE